MPINTSGITLADRVKELSYDGGTSNFRLSGAAQGFSSFSSLYSSGDVVFYAITDGIDYEIGSGVYHYKSSAEDELSRSAFASTNSDALVNFPLSTVKEVFVTYPADFSVYTASGLSSEFHAASESGIAFWQTRNILNYDPELIWDASNNRLGISNNSPDHAIDIGGTDAYSHIRVSGMTLDSSGVFFPSGNSGSSSYVGGRQLEHFLRNDLLDGTDGVENTNVGELIQISGAVSQYLGFVKQEAGQILAGPPSGCEPGCSPEYPSFRQLTADDIPTLGGYVTQYGDASKSGVAFFRESGVIAHDSSIVWDSGLNRLGILFSEPTQALSVSGNALVSGNLYTEWAYVSGIYGLTAGSGLDLGSDNLTFNVSDMFDVAASGSSATVSQADTIIVSGVSGVNTIMTSDGTTHKIIVDANELSGVLSDRITATTYEAGSGLELSGTKFNAQVASGVSRYDSFLPSGGAVWNFVSGVSGWLNSNLTLTATSGIVLSGVAPGDNQTIVLSPPSGYLDFLVSGDMEVSKGRDKILVWDESDSKWEWTHLADVNYKFGSAAGGDVNEYSWKTITVNSGDTGWSPWGTLDVIAANTTDKLNLVAGSGIILTTAQGLTESGVRIEASGYLPGSGLELSSNLTFNVASGGLIDSGIVMLQNSIDKSIWTAATPSSVYEVSGFLASKSYWDGNLSEDSGLYLPTGNFGRFGGGTDGYYSVNGGQHRSVVLGIYDPLYNERLGATNKNSVIIGLGAGIDAANNTSVVNIGHGAGYEAEHTERGVSIGYGAGSGVVNAAGPSPNPGLDSNIFIGDLAGKQATNAYGTIAIGNRARAAGSNAKFSVYVGTYAGANLTGSGNIELLHGNENNSLTSSANNRLNIGNTIIGDLDKQSIAIGSGHLVPGASLDIRTSSASTSPLHVSGVPDMAADLTQWTVENAVRLSVSKSGILVMNYPITSGEAPDQSIFIEKTSNRLSWKQSSTLAYNIPLGDAVATYVPPSVIDFSASSGTLGITTGPSGDISSANGKYVRCRYNGTTDYNGSNIITVNVPHSTHWNPDIGTEIMFEQNSGINVTLRASGDNISINGPYTKTTAGTYSVITIKKVDTNDWTVMGDVE